MLVLGIMLEFWVLATISVLLAGLWVQILILHYRGAFYRAWMWVPIFSLPVVVVAGVVALAARGTALDVLGVLFAIMFVIGVTGMFFHIQGITRRVGGWNLDNIMVGPPFLLPPSLSLVSLVGVITVLFWRA